MYSYRYGGVFRPNINDALLRDADEIIANAMLLLLISGHYLQHDYNILNSSTIG